MPPNEWIGLSDSVTARVNTEIDMLPPVGQMPVIDDEQPAPRLKPYGSDSSLKPVTSLLSAEDAPFFPELQML